MVTPPMMRTSPLRTTSAVLGCIAALLLLNSDVRDYVSHVLHGDFLPGKGGERMESGRLLYEYYSGVQKQLDGAMSHIQSILEKEGKEGGALGELTEVELHDYLINLFLADTELQKNTKFIQAIQDGVIIIHREIFFDKNNVKKFSFSFSVAFQNSTPHLVTVTPNQLIEVFPRFN